MAVITFGIRWLMKVGFTDGHGTIMTVAAISKYFLMINKGENGKSLGGMTGLAGITGSDVIRRFNRNIRIKPIEMTIHTI